MRDRGLDECISYSFTSPRALERLRLGSEGLLRLENPLSEEQSVMRPLLLPGLLDAARHNAAHGRPALALFESAHVYRPSGPLDSAASGSPGGATPALERQHLAVLQTQALPGGWRSERAPGGLLLGAGAARGGARGSRGRLARRGRGPAVPAPGPRRRSWSSTIATSAG